MARWLHLSPNDLGDEFLFIPRVPESRAAEECSVTKRICVSDTIERCLMGVEGCDIEYLRFGGFGPRKKKERQLPMSRMFLYELQGEGYKPKEGQVGDEYRTNEHWILKPTLGILVNIIEPGDI